MSTEEKVAFEEVQLARPYGIDARYIYRIRYTTILTTDDDGALVEKKWRQEYGGFGGQWREYSGFDVLDMSFPGVIVLDGREGRDVIRCIEEGRQYEAEDRAHLRELRDAITEALGE